MTANIYMCNQHSTHKQSTRVCVHLYLWSLDRPVNIGIWKSLICPLWNLVRLAANHSHLRVLCLGNRTTIPCCDMGTILARCITKEAELSTLTT